MNKEHLCKVCNYKTDRLSSFKKHLQTNKHKKNSLKKSSYITPNNGVIAQNNVVNLNKVKCEYCNKFIHKSNKPRHYSHCKMKDIVKKDKEINELLKKNKKLEEINLQLKKERDEYKKEYFDILKLLKTTKVSLNN